MGIFTQENIDHMKSSLKIGGALILSSWFFYYVLGIVNEGCLGCGTILGLCIIIGSPFTTPGQKAGPMTEYIVDDILGNR